jgi:ferritin-like metal-binding protein YciE
VEHYEIASYGTARAWAERLGYDKAARLLQQTLEEESMANEKLTRIAESHVNMEAQ